jgi:hypothetical protein
VRLNVGCGSDIRPGYLNVDFRKLPGVDDQVDLSVFPWPYADGSAEEVLMLDFLEHFPYAKTRYILMECRRILHAGGEVVIQVPDAQLLGRVISGLGQFPCNRCGMELVGRNNPTGEWAQFCPKCGQDEDDAIQAAVHRMFGGQDSPGNWHQTCFTKDSLVSEARACGLYFNHHVETAHQRLNWNFKSVFTLGDIW